MQKKGIFLPQETNETCGISCILMALTAFGRIKKPQMSAMDEKSTESIFYEMYGFNPDGKGGRRMGTLGSAIAYALSCRRLDVQLWHESEALIENRDGYFPEALHEKMLAAHREWIAKAQGAFVVRAGMTIDAQVIRAELARERLVIVQCLVEGDADGMHDHVLHWILMFDWKDVKFRAYDPAYTPPSRKSPSYIELTEQELEAYMDTPVGAAAVSVGARGTMSGGRADLRAEGRRVLSPRPERIEPEDRAGGRLLNR